MRKATLRGHGNPQKRYNFAAACYNLSQLLRKKFGCGTLKMAQAAGPNTLFWPFLSLLHLFTVYRQTLSPRQSRFSASPSVFLRCLRVNTKTLGFSTVC
jgi:hypothetical protein